ncbi:iron sulfur assembly protein [Aspergillus flavus]|nr:iron sulfur assembly protein [Aspergillus flavus]
MSRSMLSSAARQLWRQRSPRTGVSAFPSSKPRSSISASFSDPTPRRSISYAICESKTNRLTSPRRSLPAIVRLQQRCAFSSTSTRPATKVIQNPRTGEDGNPLTIEISPRAAERLREVTDPTSSPSVLKEENPYHHLRITVTSGGCHGFQYMMSLEAASKIDPEEDTVFEAEYSPEEGSSEAAGQAKVVMDEPSLELLYGSTVDYTMELIGSQFKIVDNPRATSNCGCGTSFDVTD